MIPQTGKYGLTTVFQSITQPYGKVIGAALNYRIDGKHSDLKAPIFFLKPSTSVAEEGTKIKIPSYWKHVHTEVELGVIIGKPITKPIPENSDTFKYIAGYQLIMDLSNMDMQNELRQLQCPWFIAKSFDTSTPVSKTIIQTDDPTWHSNVDLELKINSQIAHSGNTSNLLFSIPQQIQYLSKFMTLLPGDLILSGTPPGSTAIRAGDHLVARMKGLNHEVSMEFDVE
ncbi:hypothetical protein GJ496_011208 [Pomphorhynchus laevis]|nr:hypothetical protein GJ496_011208 [Pomphorhynchus laevis]